MSYQRRFVKARPEPGAAIVNQLIRIGIST